MNPASLAPQPLAEPRERTEPNVRAQARALLESVYPERQRAGRRRDTRYPFPYLVYLTPVGSDGRTPNGETLVVVGKHLSERGLGFYHCGPLPYRRVIASLDQGGGRWLGFLIDLTWCRFTRQGWYESGGRFVTAVRSPLQETGTS